MSIQVNQPKRYFLYLLFGAIWLSGLTFFVLSTWFQVEGEFGLSKHPWQYPALQLHGLCAFVFMVTYGYMIGSHMTYGWKANPKRKWGIFLASLPLCSMLTAYLLYYIVEGFTREVVGYIHLAVGMSLPVALAMHILTGRRRKRLRKPARTPKEHG